jgi:succinyl-CoA synthetase beta subunit
VTKKDDLHALVSGLDPNKAYVISTDSEVVSVPYSDLESAIGRLLCSAEEILVREQEEAFFECSLEVYVSTDCKMFLKLAVGPLQGEEEIVNKKLWDFQVERLMCVVGLPRECGQDFQKMAHAVFSAFCSYGATRLVINPVMITKSKMVLAIRAQLLIDDCSYVVHKKIFSDTSLSEYPVIVDEGVGNIVCIANSQPLVLALVDALSAHGIHASMAIDIGAKMDEKSIGKAFTLASTQKPKQKILIYFFTGLENASIAAKAVGDHLGKVSCVGLFLEGTNVSGAGYVLHNDREQCSLLLSLQSAVAWAKKE